MPPESHNPRLFTATDLIRLARDILGAAGALPDESEVVAEALVNANLDGVDSHGILRVPEYVGWLKAGLVTPGAAMTVIQDGGAFAVVDGNWGFGQVVGRQAVRLAIGKASAHGIAAVFGRNSCHLGRLGDYPALAAEQGMVALMFANTHGAGKLVAPWGGRERRLSANPIASGIPRREGPPLILDISTSAIAEGKVRNRLHRGLPIPEGCVIDANGMPSNDPAALYGPPPGALLPFGGHKGFGLSLLTDVMAGALSGAGCSRPGVERIGNAFTIFVVDVEAVRGLDGFTADTDALVAYVKSAALAPGYDGIAVPGEPEVAIRAARQRDGIPLDAEIWRQLCVLAGQYGTTVPDAQD